MVKKRKSQARQSAAVHRSRAQFVTSGRALVAKRIVVVVITLALVAVAVVLVNRMFFNDEKIVQRRLDEMAAEYYEGYIYENLIHGAMSQTEIEEAMDMYALRGFAAVNLRQLLLYDNGKNAGSAELVQKYCDVNATSVKFYPEAPFDKKSYRMEFRYDCDGF